MNADSDAIAQDLVFRYLDAPSVMGNILSFADMAPPGSYLPAHVSKYWLALYRDIETLANTAANRPFRQSNNTQVRPFYSCIALLNWAVENNYDGLNKHPAVIMHMAVKFRASNEVLDKVRAMLHHELTPDVSYIAAQTGDIRVLGWTVQNGLAVYRGTCEGAAEKGHLNVLMWIRAQAPDCPWGLTCTLAATGGHLQLLQWARAQPHPAPWDEWTCASAAESGRLTMLQWLREQDPPCPWNHYTCTGAVRGGHVEILQWAIEHGCPYRLNTLRSAAAARGNPGDMIAYIDTLE